MIIKKMKNEFLIEMWNASENCTTIAYGDEINIDHQNEEICIKRNDFIIYEILPSKEYDFGRIVKSIERSGIENIKLLNTHCRIIPKYCDKSKFKVGDKVFIIDDNGYAWIKNNYIIQKVIYNEDEQYTYDVGVDIFYAKNLFYSRMDVAIEMDRMEKIKMNNIKK